MAPGIIPPWAALSPILGGLGASSQGEAGPLAPESRLRPVPQGCSPPAEAAHGPDSAARVPGRIDVRGWGGKSKSRAWVWAVRPLTPCTVCSRGWQGPVHAHSAPHRGPQLTLAHLPRPRWDPPSQQGHPERLARPVLGRGERWETGIQAHQQPLPPRAPPPGSRPRPPRGQEVTPSTVCCSGAEAPGSW